MAWQALLPVLQNPMAQNLMIGLAGGVYNSISPNRTKEIQDEVIQDMQSNRKRLSRMSRGKFTAAERQDIRQGAEPAMNQLQGNLAQRGLGTSGAGAQVMGQAAMQPMMAAQQGAMQALPGADSAIAQALSGMPADTSFFDDLGAAVRSYHTYRGLRSLGEMDDDPDDDPLVADFMNNLIQMANANKQAMLNDYDDNSWVGRAAPGQQELTNTFGR